jgi:hypothetical protein
VVQVATSQSRIELRPGTDRERTRTDWLDSAHSFSFGHAYDPDNLGFGLLIAHNEDRIAPRSGYAAHPHRDTEIVTWVLAGELTHRDAAGHHAVLRPGAVQRVSAGTGITHSELNESDGFVHLVQMWLMPDETPTAPDYQQLDVTERLAEGGLVPLVSGLDRHRGAPVLGLRQRGAALSVARLAAGASVELPDAPLLHLFLGHGQAALGTGGRLVAGDAARITGGPRTIGGPGFAGGATVVGGPPLVVTALRPAELLVWEMYPVPKVGP